MTRYYFRDQQGLEVDFVVPAGHQRLVLVEAKASRTVVPQMAAKGLSEETVVADFRATKPACRRR